MTFTYRYSAQITKEFQYHRLLTVLCDWGENSPFLPFSSVCPSGEILKIIYWSSVALNEGLVFCWQEPSMLLLLLCAPLAWGVVSLRGLLLCISSVGMAQPTLKRECVRDQRCDASPVSHTPSPSELLLSCVCLLLINPVSLPGVTQLCCPFNWLENGWLSCPSRMVWLPWIFFNSCPYSAEVLHTRQQHAYTANNPSL